MSINILIKKIKDTVNRQISPVEFTQWYEDWFSDEVEEQSVDKIVYIVLENLYNDIGYFEPNKEIRKEHSSYYGVEKLIEKLIDTLKEIS